MLSVPSRFTTFSDFMKFLIPHQRHSWFLGDGFIKHPRLHALRTQSREQVIGQAVALPTMTLYAFVGIVTSATVGYGTAIWDHFLS